MDRVIKPRAGLESIKAYDSPQPEAEIILNSNESPYNIPDELIIKIEEQVEKFDFNRYPDPGQFKLKEKISIANKVNENMISLGNGGDELLLHAMMAYGGPERTLLDFPPTFSVYNFGATITGTKYRSIYREDDFSIDMPKAIKVINDEGIKLVFLCNPNNPTGTLTALEDIERLLSSSQALVLIDEAYYQYSKVSCQKLLQEHKNLSILRTFSKAFSFAGMRVGYIMASPEIISNLEKVRLPYNVNALSQALAALVLDNSDLFKRTVEQSIKDRELLYSQLKKIKNIKVYPSRANYILFKMAEAKKVWKSLLDKGVLIRIFKDEDLLKNCLRVTVGKPEENELFLKLLKEIV